MSWVNSSLLRNAGFQSCLISLDSDWALISDGEQQVIISLKYFHWGSTGEWIHARFILHNLNICFLLNIQMENDL